MIRARVITCSDAASRGERVDRSGPAVGELLVANGYAIDSMVVVPDEIERIANAITDAVENGIRLIITTGGTGIAPRDVTPEATARIADRIIPGFGELMRSTSIPTAPTASLSRAQAATRGPALIINLPGNPRAAVENLGAVLHLVGHALELLGGKTEHGTRNTERGTRNTEQGTKAEHE